MDLSVFIKLIKASFCLTLMVDDTCLYRAEILELAFLSLAEMGCMHLYSWLLIDFSGAST
jgi:hypothetical protein